MSIRRMPLGIRSRVFLNVAFIYRGLHTRYSPSYSADWPAWCRCRRCHSRSPGGRRGPWYSWSRPRGSGLGKQGWQRVRVTIVHKASNYVVGPHQNILHLFPAVRGEHRNVIVLMEPCELKKPKEYDELIWLSLRCWKLIGVRRHEEATLRHYDHLCPRNHKGSMRLELPRILNQKVLDYQ